MSKLHATCIPMIAAILAVVVGACGDDGASESVYPSVALVVSRDALSLAAGALSSASGTYGSGCRERTGAWSVAIAAGAPLPHPALSVVKGDTTCVLTLSSLNTGQEHIASPPIDMTAVFQPHSSSFAPASSPPSFYANACLDALTFAADFVVIVLYSDEPNFVTGGNHAIFAAATASATASGVPVPDYTIDMTQLLVSIDSANIVQTAVGTANLIDGSVTAQSYVLDDALPSTHFVHVDDAYDDGTQIAISGANPKIPAAAFSLIGLDLSVVQFRYVILANSVNDVPSFQVITITFRPLPN